MYLIMKADHKILKRKEINLEGLKTYKQRQEYLEQTARKMHEENFDYRWKHPPIFYVEGVKSKANETLVEQLPFNQSA
jgi:hypothetical protein